MSTTKEIRNITPFCISERHGYCRSNCGCDCHFEVQVDSRLNKFCLNLWQMRDLFQIPEETPEARRARLLSLIESSKNSVNFHGYTPEEILDRLEPTLARDYWSLAETAEEFEIGQATFTRP